MAYTIKLWGKRVNANDTSDQRILEHLIQTIENKQMIQKCILKNWTLLQFLLEAEWIEDILIQVYDMKMGLVFWEITTLISQRRNQISRVRWETWTC